MTNNNNNNNNKLESVHPKQVKDQIKEKAPMQKSCRMLPLCIGRSWRISVVMDSKGIKKDDYEIGQTLIWVYSRWKCDLMRWLESLGLEVTMTEWLPTVSQMEMSELPWHALKGKSPKS